MSGNNCTIVYEYETIAQHCIYNSSGRISKHGIFVLCRYPLRRSTVGGVRLCNELLLRAALGPFMSMLLRLSPGAQEVINSHLRLPTNSVLHHHVVDGASWLSR